MKYASSIRYGGQLIEAVDCDYKDYKYLGLLCPNCKEPVFLQGSSQRMLSGKIIDISPHFKHFAAKNPMLAAYCEARIAKYNSEQIEQHITIARNQRLMLFQSHLSEICLSNHKFYYIDIETGKIKHGIRELPKIEFIDKNGIRELPKFKFITKNCFSEKEFYLLIKHKEKLFCLIDILVEEIANKSYLDRLSKGCIDSDTKNNIIYLCNSIDIKMHKSIVKEIMQFLFSQFTFTLISQIHRIARTYSYTFVGSTNWVQKLIDIYDQQWIDGLQGTLPFFELIAEPICMKLIEIPWAEEFTKRQKNDTTRTA